jgi:hypothetical protein
MAIKSYNVSAGIRKRPCRFSSCNVLDSSWPVAPRGCRDCCAPIGSDLSKTGHAVGAVNPPQMTEAAAKAMSQMMGVFAEFERSMIRERVNAGLARARSEGTPLGRPKIEAATEAAIHDALQAGGTGIRKIATRFNVGTGTGTADQRRDGGGLAGGVARRPPARPASCRCGNPAPHRPCSCRQFASVASLISREKMEHLSACASASTLALARRRVIAVDAVAVRACVEFAAGLVTSITFPSAAQR